MSKKQKTIVIVTHLIVQLVIYGILSYYHFWIFLINRITETLPTVRELVYMHSPSVIATLIIAVVFTVFRRNTLPLNVMIVSLNILLNVIYIIAIWNIYNS